MNISFIFLLISSLSLPLLAFLALLLRRNLFTGALKKIILGIGILLLGVVVILTFKEHGESFGLYDLLISLLTAGVTLLILSRFSHNHHHHIEEGGAKGIVLSEAFHSLLDGAVIGATYLINPILGYAATIGIILHELPKIIGTLALFRGIGFSVKKTITYGIAAQIGSPVSAILIYLLGKEINHKQFHFLEIGSVSSLAAIVLWIVYLELRFHKKHPRHDDSHTHKN